MNIAYITQLTNLDISDDNPLNYIQKYNQNPDFANVLKSHLLSSKLIEWAEMENMPENALDIFIEDRVNIVIEKLKDLLSGINFEVIDTRANAETEKSEQIN